MNSSRPVRLTTDGTLKQDPVFVNGEIVYTLLESPALMRLMKLKAAGPVKLHPDATTNEFEATFTPDGTAYAFVQSRGNLNMKLVIRDAATGKDAVFDPGGGFAAIRRPSIHPTGDRVCFALPAANGQQIVSVGKDGKDRKTLTSGGLNNWPAYSPDGRRIAFSSSRDGELGLYVMTADGGDVRRVTQLKGMHARPCWSPDGTRLVFTWNREGKYEIHTVRFDGTGLVRLTTDFERADYAAWRPDGSAVAFVGERAGKFDLYRVAVG